MSRYGKMLSRNWAAILLASAAHLLAACAASPVTSLEPGASIKIVRLEEVRESSATATKLVGHFVLHNRSNRDLCFMRDMIENEFSPYAVVQTRTGRGGFTGPSGTPFPPTTIAVMTLSPGASASFKRVVHYVQPAVQRDVVRLRLEARAWCCEDNRLVRLRSDPFGPTPFEPQS